MFSKRRKDEGFVNRFNKREFQLVKNENLKEILARIINKNKEGKNISCYFLDFKSYSYSDNNTISIERYKILL